MTSVLPFRHLPDRTSALALFLTNSRLSQRSRFVGTALPAGAGVIHPRSLVSFLIPLVQLQRQYLLLLSRMEYRNCVVFLMKDDSTRRVYRLYDFTKSQTITSDHYYCASGKVNRADKLYLVIESVKRDTKHSPGPAVTLEWTALEKHP